MMKKPKRFMMKLKTAKQLLYTLFVLEVLGVIINWNPYPLAALIITGLIILTLLLFNQLPKES